MTILHSSDIENTLNPKLKFNHFDFLPEDFYLPDSWWIEDNDDLF